MLQFGRFHESGTLVKKMVFYYKDMHEAFNRSPAIAQVLTMSLFSGTQLKLLKQAHHHWARGTPFFGNLKGGPI